MSRALNRCAGFATATRPDETVSARYPAEANLYPVDCFMHYLEKTRGKRAVKQGRQLEYNSNYSRAVEPTGIIGVM